MSGSTQLTISESTSSFIITNLNPTFTEMTNFTVSEQNVTAIDTATVRIVTVDLPNYVLLTDTTAITSIDSNECLVVSSTVDIGGNQLIVRVGGRVSLTLANIENPSHYAGSK